MAFFTSNPSQQNQLFSITLCKCPQALNSFKFHSSSHFATSAPHKHALPTCFSPHLVRVRAHASRMNPGSDEQSSHFWKEDKRKDTNLPKTDVDSLVEDLIKSMENTLGKDRHTGEKLDFRKRKKRRRGFSSPRSEGETFKDVLGLEKKFQKGADEELEMDKMEKRTKKSNVVSPESMFRFQLDTCSKKGDVMGALKLYDSAQSEGIKMEQYHYTVLLYLCSSAATGVIRAAKSGSGDRSLSTVESTCEVSVEDSGDLDEVDEIRKGSHSTESTNPESRQGLLAEAMNHTIHADRIELNSNGFPTEEGKHSLDSCFNGKEKLLHVSNGVAKANPQVKDGTVHFGTDDYDPEDIKDGNRPETSEIRVSEDFKKYALQRGFEIYEKMCLKKVPMSEASLTSIARMAQAMNDGDMAFDAVRKMKELGITPRLRSYGPALSAFCACGDIDKAFALEQDMLAQGVHPEEPELEALLRLSTESGRSDKVYYMLHRLRTSVRKVSHLTADLLEKWFKSKVASRVGKRKWDERLIRGAIENGGGGWHGQGWLGKGKWTVTRTSVGTDGFCKCCGEKLATIDLDPTETEKFADSVASIAIQKENESNFQQFQKWLDCYGPFEAVIDGANVGLKNQYNFSPSKVQAVVKEIHQVLALRKWPLIVLHNRRITGHHMDNPVNKKLIEDWKKADAIYTTPTGSNDDWYWLYAAIKFKCLIVTNDEMRDHLFQLLGNDFFPKWKERHQVRFNFTNTGLVIHMPPPCSVVIQESEKGYWHIPIVPEHDLRGEQTWLCVTRANSPREKPVSATKYEGCLTLLSKIEAAERLGNCVIDFEI